MTRAAYLDCFSGASGDMLLGALLDAGLPEADWREEIARLPISGYSVEVRKVERAGLAASKVDVEIQGPQPERTLTDVLGTIGASSLVTSDKEKGSEVFRKLAGAEARVHGCSPEEVILHDVGAVDAIIDVMGTVAGLRLLGIEELYCSPLPAGSGAAVGPHGVLPVPAPATLELLAQAGAPIVAGRPEHAFELLTPTAAAIITTLARFQRPSLRLEAVGYGAGSRDTPGRPNVLRVWLGSLTEVEDEGREREMVLIETNIDDMAPELLAYAQEKLLSIGAADVWFTPIQMKKNRPGVLLSVICAQAHEDAVARLLLRETSTLGVRSRPLHRWEAEREVFQFQSSLGPAAVKVKRLPEEQLQVSPEYEDCKGLAEASGLPLAEVYRIVESEARSKLGILSP